MVIADNIDFYRWLLRGGRACSRRAILLGLGSGSPRSGTSCGLDQILTCDRFMAGQILHTTEFFTRTFSLGLVSEASVSPNFSPRMAGPALRGRNFPC